MTAYSESLTDEWELIYLSGVPVNKILQPIKFKRILLLKVNVILHGGRDKILYNHKMTMKVLGLGKCIQIPCKMFTGAVKD